MGLTHVRARTANPAPPSRTASIKFLVDSGAGVLTRASHDASTARDQAPQEASPVIFGEPDDAALLGTVSLESLGLLLDPMKRVLRPLPMVLGRVR
jgi:hypothetical protein